MARSALLLLALGAVVLAGVHAQHRPAKPEDMAKFNKIKELLISQYKHDPKVHPFSMKVTMGINKNGVRGLFATEDVPKGGVLLTLPAGATLNVGGDSGDDAESTVRLITEMSSSCSRFKPYFEIFPKRGEVVNYCNFPEEYVPMLQSPYWSYLLRTYRQRLRDLVEGGDSTSAVIMLEEAIGRHNMTLEDVRYMCALVTTRVVSMSPRKTTVMLPIMDLANHRKDCPVNLGAWNHLGDWDTDLHLMATGDIKKGDELCYMYGDHRDDHMLIYYGFMPWLPAGKDSDQLFMIDHHTVKFDVEKAERDGPEWPDAEGPDMSAKSGVTAAAASAEIARLNGILAELDALSARTPNPKPLAGWENLHKELLEFQRRRRVAIKAEIAKLEAIAGRSSGAEL